jgi:histidine ammonia-lyase
MILKGNYLNLADLQKVIFQNEEIFIDQDTLKDIDLNFNFLKDFSKNRLIYGINTGFGPMAQYRIKDHELKNLQYNLIRSHCTGTGDILDDIYVRATMVCRLISFLQNCSGVHPSTVEQLKIFINQEIYPIIFQHGSVGASGDLVQLAHLALALIGEGDIHYHSEKRKTSDVLQQLQIPKLDIYIREGLALINGTSTMCGISLVNLIYAKKLFDMALLASVMTNEVVNSCDDHYSKILNSKKKHNGQNIVAQKMSTLLHDSQMIRFRTKDYYENTPNGDVLVDKVQEYYSLRCVPQILGPILDTILHAEETVLNEVNSSNDNPVVDYKTASVYHGGNFHGDYISLEMDKLKIAIIRLSMLMERQLNYLLNSKLNNKFPPFLNLGILGLNLGMQAMQFTATSTTAENQTLGFPNYVHSIPNNSDNQDIVSMGTNSALFTKRVIENSFEVLAIHFIAIIQAYEFVEDKSKMAASTKEKYEELRAIVPVFIEDTTKHEEIQKIKEHLMNIE